jgi:glycosyltransferase involved in cell wall biosynthesis
MSLPVLYIVIPCYNEEAALPLTKGSFLDKLESLIQAGRVSEDSRILFVNDGSKDATWEIIQQLSAEHVLIEGIALSRNRGHQNALLAGLMTAKYLADVTISIDCDGQDDINAMDAMLTEYEAGCEVVYGVRSNRETDTFFKRASAEGFYKLMRALGADVVFNHADYRLLSRRVLESLSDFTEVNLFLRGLVPLVGFRSSSVYYERHERVAGQSHYPLKKMLGFALDGITSFSSKPIRLITWLGFIFAFLSFIAIIVTFIQHFFGFTVAGWSSMICAVCFMGGVQLICLGVIGEYIGKIYNETKGRPRFIISDNTFTFPSADGEEGKGKEKEKEK